MPGRNGTLWESLPTSSTALTVPWTTESALSVGTVAYTPFDGQTLPPGTSPMTMALGVLGLQLPYVQAASWTSPPINPDQVQWFISGNVPNIPSTPTGTSASLFLSLDDGVTWNPVAPGGNGKWTIRGLLIQGESLVGITLRIMISLSTNSQTHTPQVSGLTLELVGMALETDWLSGMGQRLRSRLYSPVQVDAQALPVFSLSYDGGLAWTVRDLQFSVQVQGGSARSITLLLPMCTLGDLNNIFSTAAGYVVSGYDPAQDSIGAVALVEGAGNLAELNGGVLTRWSSALWDLTEAWAWEGEQQAAMVPEALAQMSISTASAPWLDEWGAYFGLARNAQEPDAEYAHRIETWPFRLQCNNLAMEQLVQNQMGLSVQCRTLRWRDDSRFLRTNVRAIYRQGVKTWPGITNSPDWICGPFDPANPHLQFLTSLGIELINGAPYWGPPENGNLLVCAFAVLLGDGLTMAQQQAVASIIEGARMGGTLALYYVPSGLLHTNTAGELTNGTLECGPNTSSYSQIQLS